MILPETAEIRDGRLWVGGCDTVELAREFGTPLHIFDQETLVRKMQSYCQAFATRYPNVLLTYAAKAFINPWLARLVADEGLGLDVVSGGEMAVAHKVNFPMDRVHFHGNNKLPEELAMAIDLGVGRVVIDNFGEISLLDELARGRRAIVEVLLRIAPGVEAHTHEYLRTGGTYSKFGVPVMTDQAAEAVEQIVKAHHLKLVGFHAHVGSQIFDLLPFEENVTTLIEFGAQMRERYDFDLLELSPGGGWGIQYTEADDPASIDDFAVTITERARHMALKCHLDLPKLVLEPGRSIVGQAGMTLYTVGSIKDIPGVRTYVAVDGGMADNIRPALYRSRYSAVAASKADQPATEKVTLAGKYCESGDILIEDITLPKLQAGDVVAIPATGAYSIPMASNYNMALKPAIVALEGGRATLVRRRQTYDDLLSCELW